MKIAQVISTPPLAWSTGGCAKSVFDLSSQLAVSGHDVTILTTDLYERNKRYCIKRNPEYINKVKILRFKYISDRLAWNNKIYISPGLILYLRKNLNNYDIVHIQDLLSIQAIAAYKYCKKFDIPYVLTTHGSIPWFFEKKLINRFLNHYYGNRIFNRASKIVALNTTEKEQCRIAGIDEDKVRIIPNGINSLEYRVLPKKGLFREKYGINDDDKVILFVGRINEIKGINYLLRAFLNLYSGLNNMKLVIVGQDDGQLSQLKQEVESSKTENQVIFTGPLYETYKLSAFVDGDICVLPSTYEIFGLVPFESIMCGTPVIVTNNCGCGELIRDANCGYLINPGSVKDIEEVLQYALKNPENGKILVNNGQKYIDEYLSIKKVTQNMLDVYESCIYNI